MDTSGWPRTGLGWWSRDGGFEAVDPFLGNKEAWETPTKGGTER